MSDHFGSIPIQPSAKKEAAPERVAPTPPKRPFRPKKGKTKSKGQKTALFLAFLVVVVAGYVAAGLWGVPRYLHSKLPALLQQHTNLIAEIGVIHFNPFSFKLEMSDVILRDLAGSPEPVLSLDSFTADLAPLPLFKGEIISTQLNLDTLHLDLIRNSEGNYNFYSSVPDDRTTSSPRFLDFRALPFRFSLNNISLSNGNLTFHDKPKNTTHNIEQIEASLPNLSNFSFQAKEYLRPSFSAVINGSPIQLTGQAAFSGNSKDTNINLKTELSCNFNAIDLNRYFEYLPFTLPFDITEGKAEGSLKLTFAQSRTDEMLSVDFSMQATRVAVNSADQSFKLMVPSVKLEGAIQPLTGNTHLKSLELREPTAQIADTFSFGQFKALASLATTKAESNSQGDTAPEVKIDLFLVDNGTVVLTGETPETAKDHWEAIQFTLKNYNTRNKSNIPDKQATLRLSGEQSNTRATFNLQGHIDEHLLPTGDLLLTNIGAEKVFPLIGLDSVHTKSGTVDAQASISFKDYPDLDIVSRISVTEGILTFNDLALTDKQHTWFSAPSIKFAGLSKEGKKLSLGSVYLKNSTMDLVIDALPALVQGIGGVQGNVGIEAVEFTGALTLSDSTKKRPTLAFTDVSLQAINLARLESSSERDNLTFTARLGKTGEIQAKGKVRLNSFITTLTTGFAGLDGAQVLPWFGNSELISEATVTLAGKGSFSYPYVSYNGQLLLQDGRLSEKDKKNKEKTYFSWQEINLQEFRYNHSPLHIGASQSTIVAPGLSWTSAKDSQHMALALSAFLRKHFQSAKNDTGKTAKLPVLELQKVVVTAGSMKYSDTRLNPAWSAEIGGLNGTIEKVSSDPSAEPSLFTLGGDLDSVPFTITGSFHLFQPARQGNTQFTLSDFPLAAFHEQLKKQVDVNTSHGEFSVKDKITWGNGMANRNGEVVFGQLQPLPNKADAAMTLALLSENNGRFVLNVNTQQSFNTAPTALATDAAAAFQKLTLKAAVSPLLLAKEDYADLIGQEYAEFEPGKILLTGKGQEALARFSNLLQAHQAIGITITGSVDSAIDGEAMKKDLEIAEFQRAEEENDRRKEALQKATEEYLAEAAEKLKATGKTNGAAEQKIPREISRRYAPIKPEKVVIDKTMLQELAKERARVVAELFTQRLALAPERVSVAKKLILNSDKEIPGNRVLFTIETVGPVNRETTSSSQ